MSLKGIFTASEMHFDALIYLRGKHLVRRKAVKGKSLQNVLPVCDYDPLGNYLNALRASFGHFAIFFHDKYNGDRIGMVWKPEALKPKEANVGLFFKETGLTI